MKIRILSFFTLTFLTNLSLQSKQSRDEVFKELSDTIDTIESFFSGFGVYKISPNMSKCLDSSSNQVYNIYTLSDQVKAKTGFTDAFFDISLYVQNFSVDTAVCFQAIDTYAIQTHQRLDGFEKFSQLSTAFSQNIIANMFSLRSAYNKMVAAYDSDNIKEYFYWLGKALNMVLIFEPINIDPTPTNNTSKSNGNTNNSQSQDGVYTSEVSVNFNFLQKMQLNEVVEQNYKGYRNIKVGRSVKSSGQSDYFFHPLYMADFVQGIIEGTRLVSDDQGEFCTNGFRMVLGAALKLGTNKWRQIVESLLDILYYQYDMNEGCYMDVIMPVIAYNKLLFSDSDPVFITKNILKSFGPLVQDGSFVVQFFKSDEKYGSQYQNVGFKIGNFFYNIFYQ